MRRALTICGLMPISSWWHQRKREFPASFMAICRTRGRGRRFITASQAFVLIRARKPSADGEPDIYR